MVAVPHFIEILALILLLAAVFHTFMVSSFQKIARRFPVGSVKENIFHLLGEVEITFGLWAGVLVLAIAIFVEKETAIRYLETRNFTEPLFVFTVMAVCATKPVLHFAESLIGAFSKLLPGNRAINFYFSCLFLGPLFGSFITEPAAMTLTALLLRKTLFTPEQSLRFKYATLAILFVNISIGGVLTPYAAPPVLMVARIWNWDLSFMFVHFGWKAAIAVLINSLFASLWLQKELKKFSGSLKPSGKTPLLIQIIHLLFLAGIVVFAHHPVLFMGFFLFFLGVVAATKEFQSPLRLRESLLVAFFLAGLVILGGLQGWWISPLISQLEAFSLMITSTLLTAVTDNAALTYLGSQVENLSEISRYTLVAGAVTGGGLTVMANAPNPAGFSLLGDTFGKDGIRPLSLFIYALIPTLVAFIMFWIF